MTAESRKQRRMAERLAAEFSDTIRYVHSVGWFVWKDACWREDEKDAPRRCVTIVQKNALAECVNLTGIERDQLFADARMLDMAGSVTGTIELARAELPLSTAASELDAHSHLLNTPQGVYDLNTGETHPHSQTELHTKITGAGPDDAESPGLFTSFMEQVLPDPDVREYAQRVFGYALLGEVRDQIFPIISGQGGTGKSTFLDIMLAAFGTYGSIAPSSMLVATNARSQHPTEIARLRGLRLVVVHETEKSQTLKAATMKEMTGKDKLVGRFMRQDFFEFTPSHTFILVTNYPPTLDADDAAAWDRIRVISFEQKFRGTTGENTNLSQDIINRDLGAVMRWVLDGHKAYRERGLKPPQAVIDITERYNAKVDSFSEFLSENVEVDDTTSTPIGELSAAWTSWAKSQGIPPGKSNEMHDRLRKRGFTVNQTSRPRVVEGIRLTHGLPPVPTF